MCFSIVILCVTGVYGQDWNLVYPNNFGKRGDLVTGLVLPGSNNAYLIGNDILSFDNAGNLLRSIDVDLPFQENSIRSNFDIELISENEMKMVFRNRLYSSIDTGQTWSERLSLQPVNTAIKSSSYFNAIHFPNQNTGYAVGSFEKIFKTDDGGSSWQELSANPSTAPYTWHTDVVFFDALSGYISGFEVNDILQSFDFQAFILQTNNGGQSWQRIDITTTNDFRKATLDFVNTDTGFIFFSETQQTEKIFVTNDAAQNWADITPENVNAIHSVKWLDAMVGLVFAEVNNTPILLKTIDQGQFWYEVSIPINNNLSANTINDIVFLDNGSVYTLGIGGSILFSQDTGETWSAINEANIKISEAHFVTDDTAYALTGSEIYKSTDAGQTWNLIEAPGLALSNFVLRLGFRTPFEGLVLGFGNQFARTTDGFNTFNTSSLPETFFFSNKFICTYRNDFYIAGTTSGTFSNKLLISSDGGLTWFSEDIGIDGEYVNNFQVLDDGTLIVLTDFNISRSTDNGTTWDTLYHSNDFIQNAYYLNSQVGYAYSTSDFMAGQVRKIIITDSLNTEVISILSTPNLDNEVLIGFLPIDENTLLAYGFKREGFEQFAVIWKSIDGGLSWIEETLPFQIPGNIEKMTFTEKAILAFGSQGHILQHPLDVLTTIDNPTTELKLMVYPNPTSDFVNIRHNLISKLDVEVFSSQGQLLRYAEFYEKEFVLNLSNLQTGVYILKVNGDNMSISKPIIRK